MLRRWLLIWCLFFALDAHSAAAPSVETQPLSVAIDDNYPPYVFHDSDGKLTGFLVALAIGAVLAVWVFVLRHTVQRRTAELHQQRDRIRTLINTIPDLVWLKDPEGIFLSCNPAFERLLGAPEAKIVGKTDDDFVDPETAQFFRKKDQEAIAAGKPTINEEWVNFASDGRQALLETIKTPMFDSNGNLVGVLGISRDITALRKVEHEQKRLNRALRLLSDCNLTLVHAEDEHTLLSDVCRLVVDVGGYLMAWVGFPEQDAEKSVRPVARSGYEDGYLENIRVSWDEALDIGRGPIGTAIRTGHTQVNQNYVTNVKMAPWHEAATKRGYKSGIGLPLIIRGQTIGALSVYSTEPDAFSPQEVVLLEELARNLAFGVDTLRMRSKNKAAQAELAIAATAFNSQESMVVTDAHSVILRVNQAFTEATGYTAEEAIGQTPGLLKSGRQDAEFYHAMWNAIQNTGIWQGEIWNRRKNGEDYQAWLTISVVKDNDGVVTNYVGTQFDITDRKKAEEKIQNLAFFDQLTGLPNRTLLLDRLKQAMTASSRSGSHCALMFTDLDDFKTINDTLGHEAGDFVLKQVAQRLTACVREGDSVARLGGDEFLLMLVGLSMNETDAATQVETVAEKILAALNQPYRINESPHHCSPSIGVTLFKGHGTPVENLLKQADLAMYRAKAAGRNTVRFFDPEMETVVMARAAMEMDLREAIRQNQFLLHYQPQVVSNGRVTGAEALVRWQHPQHGMVSPAQFIPMAEENGLILTLGEWVLDSACRQLANWATQPEMADLIVAVNVSARQFRQPDFVEQVLTIIGKTGANPQRLKLELTESMLVENLQDIIEKMFTLKAKGVGFSLDDFGTGYSSLSYLKRLPLDQLKIDQSFVRDVLIDPNDAAIARTIVMLAQSLGLGVIAEGVETAEQRDFLANSGCHAYQGYFFSRPLPLENFEQFARQQNFIWN